MINESKIIRDLINEMPAVGKYIYIEIHTVGMGYPDEYSYMAEELYNEILSYATPRNEEDEWDEEDEYQEGTYEVKNVSIGQMISDEESVYLKIKIQ